MTFELSETTKPSTGEQVIRLMKMAQRDIDKAFYVMCAIEHPEMITAYMNTYIAIENSARQ